MPNKAIEIFYLFFQGVLTFQVLIFTVLYFVTQRKDILYYALFLLFAALYFFINAPYTFFGIPEESVWNSAWYDYINTPVIIVENLFYLLFLKTFFADITNDKIAGNVFRITLWLIPFLFLLFIILTLWHTDKEFIFYTVKLITVIPSAIVAYIVFKRELPFARLVGAGLICSIAGTTLTVCMIASGNYFHVNALFTSRYLLFFIRIGVLCDMVFYFMAILYKWHAQEKQLAVEKLQSLLAVEKLTNKISAELHDDVGSTLSGINMYSHLMNDYLESGKYEEAKKSAGIISRSAAEINQALSELVWAIKPETGTLQTLIQRLEEYAGNMAATKNMKVKINVPDYLYEHCLPMESRRNIYLFCKEAINNAVKYSNGTLLELSIKEANNKLEFSVSDNGKGYDPVTVRRGNGLGNMQKRADEIGAKLIVQSKKDEGSLVSMQVKIT